MCGCGDGGDVTRFNFSWFKKREMCVFPFLFGENSREINRGAFL